MLFSFFIDESDRPLGFVYPQSYIEYVSGNIPDLEPRSFLWPAEMENRPKGLRERYPQRILVPFARRTDNDDIACFDASELSKEPKVLIIHDFASPGWEKRGELNSFEDWLELAEKESKEWQED